MSCSCNSRIPENLKSAEMFFQESRTKIFREQRHSSCWYDDDMMRIYIFPRRESVSEIDPLTEVPVPIA